MLKNNISKLPLPIKIVIERVRVEVNKVQNKETLSVCELLRIFYLENQVFSQHDKFGSLTLDIKGKELSIYNDKADIEAIEGCLGFCVHYESNLYLFDINIKDPNKNVTIYKTKDKENISANPQSYTGEKNPYIWYRDKKLVSMLGYSKYALYKQAQDEKDTDRIIYEVEFFSEY